MIHPHDAIRRHLLEGAGLAGHLRQRHMTLERVYETQWSSYFERLRRNRMVMGFYRYGGLRSAARRAKSYDHVGSTIKRLQAYLRTGNQECLVDAANLCMIEFMLPSCHPAPCWKPVDDGEHTRRR